MKRYIQLKHPQTGETVEVKDGLCWWAMFGWLWSWSNRLGWRTGLLLFVLSAFSRGLADIYYVIRGNGWILEKYLKSGFVIDGTPEAYSWALRKSLKRFGYEEVLATA